MPDECMVGASHAREHVSAAATLDAEPWREGLLTLQEPRVSPGACGATRRAQPRRHRVRPSTNNKANTTRRRRT